MKPQPNGPNMSDTTQLALSFLGGAALGALFFGGLWWTLQQLTNAKHPALLVLGSALLRMAAALLGFYVCVRINVTALLLCLAGFLLMRVLLTRALRVSSNGGTDRQEPSHAP
jgi:F1F0 ATPase subunit 2